MGGFRLVILVLTVASATMLLAVPLSSASDNYVVHYTKNPDIKVDFPNGNEITKGEDFIIVTSSDVYDMERSGIMFYKCDQYGVPDETTSITPDSIYDSDGNVMTCIFSNLSTDIEMDFTELEKLDTPNENTLDEKKVNAGEVTRATAVMLATVIIAAIMLAIMIMIFRMLNTAMSQPEKIS
jgi:hypothetical protein